jgi:hypothetical protein
MHRGRGQWAACCSVSASFGVPTVDPSSTVAYTTAWVGTGGVFGNALLQGGTIEERNGFGDQDTAFVEDDPNPALDLQGLPVSPGEQTSASIPPNTQSAQWTTEDPSCGSSLCPFADVTPVTSSSVADLATSPVSRAPVEALIVNAEGAQRTMVSPSSIGSTAAATGTSANCTVSRPGESGTSPLSLFGLLGSLF